MGRVPEFRLIVQTDERGVSGTCPENTHSGKFLIQGPGEFVHVHVGVCGGRRDRERNAGDCALLVHHLFETRQIRRVGNAHRPALVTGHQALELDGHQACQAVGLISRDETPDCFRWYSTAAQIVVVLVEIVASGIRGVGLPIVGGPAIAAVAVKSELGWSAGNSGIEIDAIDPKGNRFSFGWIDRNRHIRHGTCGCRAGLRGIGTFTGSVYRRYHVIVGRAVCHGGIYVVRHSGRSKRGAEGATVGR